MSTPRIAATAAPTRTSKPNPPNARRTMDALRELGYDSYASVLDLLDNSIDAQAKDIAVSIREQAGDVLIQIDDDGIGMDEDTLNEALRIGSAIDREIGDLGRFGMGLVTASIGLSRCVEVLTRIEGLPPVAGGFDLDEIAERNEFLKWCDVSDHEIEGFAVPHGTRVNLSKTDRISNRRPSDFAAVLRKRIGQVFRKYLKAGVRVTVNDKPVEPIEPLMLSHPETRLLLEMEIPVEGTATAMLRVVELPDLGQAGNRDAGIIPHNSGFYVLRNNREIMEAQTFEFYRKHADFSHFRAELSFDGSLDNVFHTDVKKMSITPSQSFLDKLRQVTAGLITEAGRHGRRRANVERGEVDHSLAESNITRRTPLIPKPKALIERRSPKTTNGKHGRGTGDRTRTPHVSDLRTVTGLKVIFNEGDYGEGPFYLVRQEGRNIIVTYNREHPFWRELVEHASEPKVIATLDYLVFGLANAELMVPEPAQIVKQSVNSTLVGLLV